jgi:hypothetical protein
VSRGIQQLIARPTTPPSRLHHGSMAAARTNQATMLERASYTSSVAVTRKRQVLARCGVEQQNFWLSPGGAVSSMTA